MNSEDKLVHVEIFLHIPIYEERNDYVSLIISGFLEYEVLFFLAGLTFFIAELLLLARTNLHLTSEKKIEIRT